MHAVSRPRTKPLLGNQNTTSTKTTTRQKCARARYQLVVSHSLCVCVCVVCVVYIEWAASDDHSLARWAYSTARAVSQVVARARRILMYKLRAPQYSLALRPAAPQSDDIYIYIRIYYTYAAPRTKYYLIVTRDHDFFFCERPRKTLVTQRARAHFVPTHKGAQSGDACKYAFYL